ncbi:SIMPL domain-containing protein [Vallitalea okinawensis]|uniref:SIMPL domain-containing protein n=1 Tax=Vallitalea okinawensis TaxID=2078660 RepID=UPI000CFD6A19|nr:SIMPL domain-containing protein [Vallitalea okinawensis]
MNPYVLYRMQQQPQLMRQHQTELTVEGKGLIEVEPDIAIITLGAVTEGEDIEEVQMRNEEIMENIVGSIKEYGIKSEDIQTVQYDIYPKYDYVDGKQTLRGYEVSNVIEFRLRDLNKDDDVIRSAVAAGANIQLGIIFTVSEPEKYYNLALNQALVNGRQKAKEMADTIGVTLIPVPVHVIEKSTYMGEVRTARASTLMEAGSIQAGTIDVTAAVEEKFKLME